MAIDSAAAMPNTVSDPSVVTVQHVCKPRWTAEEDALLTQCVKKYGPRWRDIVSMHFESRNHEALRKRWKSIQKNASPDLAQVSTQPPAEEEANVSENMTSMDWRELDAMLGQVDNQSHLSSNENQWTLVDDELLVQCVHQHGQHWREIGAMYFMDRTYGAIRDRWKVLQSHAGKALGVDVEESNVTTATVNEVGRKTEPVPGFFQEVCETQAGDAKQAGGDEVDDSMSSMDWRTLDAVLNASEKAAEQIVGAEQADGDSDAVDDSMSSMDWRELDAVLGDIGSNHFRASAIHSTAAVAQPGRSGEDCLRMHKEAGVHLGSVSNAVRVTLPQWNVCANQRIFC